MLPSGSSNIWILLNMNEEETGATGKKMYNFIRIAGLEYCHLLSDCFGRKEKAKTDIHQVLALFNSLPFNEVFCSLPDHLNKKVQR